MQKLLALLVAFVATISLYGCVVTPTHGGYVVRPAPVRVYVNPLWYDYPYYYRYGRYYYYHPQTRVIVYHSTVRLIRPPRYERHYYEHRYDRRPPPPRREWRDPRYTPPYRGHEPPPDKGKKKRKEPRRQPE